MDEFPFKFSAPQQQDYIDGAARWAESRPSDPNALLALACAQLTRRDYEAANITMARAESFAAAALTAMRFGIGPPGPARIALPPVTGEYPKGPSFFLSCDQQYLLSYGLPLIRSMVAIDVNVPIHLHLMSNDWSVAKQLHGEGISVTVEDPTAVLAASKIDAFQYYGAARLIRFAEALEQASGALCMLDVDALAYGDPMEILEATGDIGLRVRPGRVEPWHQFSACMVLGRPGGAAYFRRAAEIIAGHLHAPFWGLDQYALFSAWVGQRPDLALFGPDRASVTGLDPGTIMFTAGKTKRTLATDDTLYARLFRQYAGL